jgi:ribose 5-phosphate isomerase RpiB
MDKNGQVQSATAHGQVLRWQGPLVSAEELRRRLNGQEEIVVPARAIITPLAVDELRANGVRINRQTIEEQPSPKGNWGYVQERSDPLVRSAVGALEREGLVLTELRPKESSTACQWAKAVAECVAGGECDAGLVFCSDAGLVCCVANKLAGLRAIAVASLPQAARAKAALGPNLVAIEMPGRTFFELRQIIRTLCQAAHPVCPAGVANTLRELDGHAHR